MVQVHLGPGRNKGEVKDREIDRGFGDVAQLGERLPCKQVARGSNPLISKVEV